ncbi:MAG TPA: EAL domain-containing protein, partial [Bacilli bacterium]|nr:EAL domain-containing protein [Bacilli bacterium]
MSDKEQVAPHKRYKLKGRHVVSQLKQTKHRLSQVLNTLGIATWSTDMRTRKVIHCSESIEMIFGCSRQELIEEGVDWRELIHPEDRKLLRDLEEKLRQGHTVVVEYRVQHPSGEVRWVQDRETPTLDASGQLVRIDGVAIDVTDRKRAEEKIKRMAFSDDLTGLPNRRLLKQDLADLVTGSPSGEAAVMVIDLDRFKYINDTLGHTAGDRVLRRVARRLKECLVDHGTIYRPGGDEFIVILPQTGREQAIEIAERIAAQFDKPVTLDDTELYVTPSIGISLYPQDGEDVDSLVKKADTAMYLAKGSGKKYCFLERTKEELFTKRLRLENDMRKALEEKQFELYYQPKFNLQTNEIVSAEALIRWHHPEFGMVSPGDFIPVAEETRLIIPLSRWVLQTACRQAKLWLDKGFPLRVAVNVSVYQFESEWIVEEILEVLDEIGLPPSYLELEITEGIYMKDLESTIAKLQRLRAAGVHISIDDFGTGFSSLQYLQRLPINTLKIDKSFLDDLTGAV